jgi:hypothetical protein
LTHPDIPPVVELELNELVAEALVEMKPPLVGRVVLAEIVQDIARMMNERLASRLFDGL